MADPVIGLTTGAERVLSQVVAKHRQRLPDAGQRTHQVPPVASEWLFCKLDDALTQEMLDDGETVTATIWIDNPDWGPGEAPYITTTQVINNVVSWDKATPLPADTLCIARFHCGFHKVIIMICEGA